MRAPTLTFKRAGRLRRELTLPEVLLWQALRGGQLHGLRFRRQHPIGPYILDFFCASARLAVEVDGAGHDYPDRVRHDAARDAWLERRGIRVLRLRADDLLRKDGLADVLQAIVQATAPSTAYTELGCCRVGIQECSSRDTRLEWSPSPVNGGGSGGRLFPRERGRIGGAAVNERGAS